MAGGTGGVAGAGGSAAGAGGSAAGAGGGAAGAGGGLAGAGGSGGGGGAAGAGGGAVACSDASGCSGATTACGHPTCVAGQCGVAYAQANTVVTDAVGNCHKSVCDGAGTVVSAIDNSDLPVDGNPCTSDLCSAGSASNPRLAAGTICSSDGASVCDTTASCKPLTFRVLRVGDGQSRAQRRLDRRLRRRAAGRRDAGLDGRAPHHRQRRHAAVHDGRLRLLRRGAGALVVRPLLDRRRLRDTARNRERCEHDGRHGLPAGGAHRRRRQRRHLDVVLDRRERLQRPQRRLRSTAAESGSRAPTTSGTASSAPPPRRAPPF